MSTTRSAANNQNSQAQLTWDALTNMGVPMNYDAFAARWNSEEPNDANDVKVLKSLVDKFDGRGLVLKTNDREPTQQGGEQGGTSDMATAAMRATRAGKMA